MRRCTVASAFGHGMTEATLTSWELCGTNMVRTFRFSSLVPFSTLRMAAFTASTSVVRAAAPAPKSARFGRAAAPAKRSVKMMASFTVKARSWLGGAQRVWRVAVSFPIAEGAVSPHSW